MDAPNTAGITAEQIAHHALQADAGALVLLVRALDEPQRRKAARQMQQALAQRARTAADLDLYIEVMRALIAAGMRDAREAGSTAEGPDATVMDHYNALSYNFAADLADCWPGDTTPRMRGHYEAALAAAEDCVRWRNELGKPPRSFALAFWAKGMHLLSLDHYGGAVKSFGLALGFAVRAAEDERGSSMPEASALADAPFDVVLNTGYLGIAEARLGEGPGQSRYEEALAAFRAQVEAGGDEVEDAKFGLAQLEHVAGKYLP